MPLILEIEHILLRLDDTSYYSLSWQLKFKYAVTARDEADTPGPRNQRGKQYRASECAMHAL